MKNKLKKTPSNLSNYEQNVLLPIFINALKEKKEKENAVTCKQMVEALQSHGLKLNERNVGRIINYIRLNDLIVGLMASREGYYTTNNEQEIIGYEDSLKSRETSIRELRMSIKRQRRAMFSPVQKERQTQLF